MTIANNPFEPGYELPLLKKRARNAAAGHKGSIHDDEEARRRGYPGGFVPGGTSVAYITELLVDSFGASYFETGRLKVRLVQPVFSGDEVSIKATVTEVEPEEGGRRVHLDVWLENSKGDRCVRGTASARI